MVLHLFPASSPSPSFIDLSLLVMQDSPETLFIHLWSLAQAAASLRSASSTFPPLNTPLSFQVVNSPTLGQVVLSVDFPEPHHLLFEDSWRVV